MGKIKVGVLGATGIVGQNYISLLTEHPWFDVSYVTASEKSVGKTYKEAVKERWHIQREIPKGIENLIVRDATKLENALNECQFVFSALEMDKQALKELESEYAKHIPVVSNTSAHRWTEDVPILIPEINSEHINIIPQQQKNHGWKGFIVVKPNCTLQSYIIPVYALIKENYEIKKIIVTTLQALSGAGYPGVSSLDITNNIIPYISGEEEKTNKSH